MNGFHSPLLRAALLVAALSGASAPRVAASAETHRDKCDGPETSWTISLSEPRDIVVRLHRRNSEIKHEGTGSEQFAVESQRNGAEILLAQELSSPGRVIPELKATVWVRSNRAGARIQLRVIFPNQKEPGTGKVLQTLIDGTEYNQVDGWQMLTCEATEKALQNEIRFLRARFNPENINTSGSYVDWVLVREPAHAGVTEIFVDDLQVGPLVDFRSRKPVEGQAAVLHPVAEMRQGQLEIGGRPQLTIMVKDHGESLTTLNDLHVNTVLVQAIDPPRLAGLKQQGLRVAAPPPSKAAYTPTAKDALGDDGPADSPYGWPEISMWCLGTQIQSQRREEIVARMEQLRRNDYQLRRPALADVLEEERFFSRYVSMLGTSRHILGTTFPFKEYREWLSQRSRLANPGTNLFTWLQAEPVPATNVWRTAAGLKPVVIEPEQYRLQLYAAMSAGFRGFGYWTRSSLEADVPGALERRLAIAQLNLELQLIEPFLAAANLSEHVPFRIDERTPKLTRGRVDFTRDEGQRELLIAQKLAEREMQQKNQRLSPTETDAAVFWGPYYKLVVVTWLGHDAQFVPGKLAAQNTKILIPEPSESAHFWELTTTGVKSLAAEKTVGFYRVTLPKFDQTTLILASAQSKVRDQVEEQVKSMAQASARISIELARAKFQRVEKINEELASLGAVQPDARYLLYQAAQLVTFAETGFQQGNYNQAREAATDAMQSLRILQYAHWNAAVTPNRSASISSPYTVCFQTLPDHWRLLQRMGRDSDHSQENLLPSGNFEDADAVVRDWTHSQNATEGVLADAGLCPTAHSGNYSLRLIAVARAGVDPPEIIPKPPVTVVSPPVPVHAGQLLYISGWIKLTTPGKDRITRSLDGVSLSDNLEGSLGALRFTAQCDWQRFQLLREVRENVDLKLSLSLHGMGEVLLDDLRIVPIDDRAPTRLTENSGPLATPEKGGSPAPPTSRRGRVQPAVQQTPTDGR